MPEGICISVFVITLPITKGCMLLERKLICAFTAVSYTNKLIEAILSNDCTGITILK